jgi:hypothetical protein
MTAASPASWFNDHRAMRAAALILLAAAAFGCRRGALQDDAGAGAGAIGPDAATRGDGAANPGDATPGPIDGPGASDVAFPTADANCGMTGIEGSRLSAEILVVLDRAISVEPDRWNSFLSAIAAMITRNASVVDWGLYAFPTTGAACSTATVGTAIDVVPTPDDATHVIAHLAASGTVTGGTPTAAAIDVAAAYMLARTTVNPKFLLLVTDGAPNCAGKMGAITTDPLEAVTDAVAAIARAKAAGLPTFVVAPSTTSAAADVAALNALAVAGGYAERGEIKFDTEASISTWFQPTETGDNCVVPLGMAPPVPEVVTVTFNGAIVPRDTSHLLGWDYTDASARFIMFNGAWCDMVQAARSWQIEIYFGCPNPG